MWQECSITIVAVGVSNASTSGSDGESKICSAAGMGADDVGGGGKGKLSPFSVLLSTACAAGGDRGEC
jgi:hypothetical protein